MDYLGDIHMSENPFENQDPDTRPDIEEENATPGPNTDPEQTDPTPEEEQEDNPAPAYGGPWLGDVEKKKWPTVTKELNNG